MGFSGLRQVLGERKPAPPKGKVGPKSWKSPEGRFWSRYLKMGKQPLPVLEAIKQCGPKETGQLFR